MYRFFVFGGLLISILHVKQIHDFENVWISIRQKQITHMSTYRKKSLYNRIPILRISGLRIPHITYENPTPIENHRFSLESCIAQFSKYCSGRLMYLCEFKELLISAMMLTVLC